MTNTEYKKELLDKLDTKFFLLKSSTIGSDEYNELIEDVIEICVKLLHMQ